MFNIPFNVGSTSLRRLGLNIVFGVAFVGVFEALFIRGGLARALHYIIENIKDMIYLI